MAILINLNHALEKLNELEGSAEYNKGVTDAFNALFDLLPVNAAPIKHGRWEDVEPAPWGQVYETCSECGTRQTLDKGKDKFCGVCGAKMDLDEA